MISRPQPPFLILRAHSVRAWTCRSCGLGSAQRLRQRQRPTHERCTARALHCTSECHTKSSTRTRPHAKLRYATLDYTSAPQARTLLQR